MGAWQRVESIDTCRRRTHPEQKAGPGGITKRRLAVRVHEGRAAAGELVKVRRLGHGMPPQRPDPTILIINGDEENVWLALRSLTAKD